MTSLNNAYPFEKEMRKKEKVMREKLYNKYNPKIKFKVHNEMVDGCMIYPQRYTMRTKDNLVYPPYNHTTSDLDNILIEYAGGDSLRNYDVVYYLKSFAGSLLFIRDDKYLLVIHGSGKYIIGVDRGKL